MKKDFLILWRATSVCTYKHCVTDSAAPFQLLDMLSSPSAVGHEQNWNCAFGDSKQENRAVEGVTVRCSSPAADRSTSGGVKQPLKASVTQTNMEQ